MQNVVQPCMSRWWAYREGGKLMLTQGICRALTGALNRLAQSGHVGGWSGGALDLWLVRGWWARQGCIFFVPSWPNKELALYTAPSLPIGKEHIPFSGPTPGRSTLGKPAKGTCKGPAGTLCQHTPPPPPLQAHPWYMRDMHTHDTCMHTRVHTRAHAHTPIRVCCFLSRWPSCCQTPALPCLWAAPGCCGWSCGMAACCCPTAACCCCPAACLTLLLSCNFCRGASTTAALTWRRSWWTWAVGCIFTTLQPALTCRQLLSQ